MNKYGRFLFGMVKYIKGRLSPEEALAAAQQTLHERISRRGENFLRLVDTAVFKNRNSPYLRLLSHLKIGSGEIARWVERDGIEGALENLRQHGVYYTVDEFKGKTEAVRGSLKLRLRERDFDNPYLLAAYEVGSGATRSAGTRIRIDYDYLAQRSLYDAFVLNMHGALRAPIANWFPVFPGAPGINSSLRFARIGNPPRKWFSQVEKGHMKVNWEKRWGLGYLFFMSRLNGVPLAKPEYVGINDAYTVALWAARALQESPTCVVYTFASSAVRVSMAAMESGLNIAGTRFLVTGEPLTPQKKAEIEATGARAVPIYGISEAGVIAAGCDQAHAQSDHCHILKDTTAIIHHPLKVEHSGVEVSSFLFTSLLYESPKVLLNVGMGDYGELGRGNCACDFHRHGFDTHVASIRSYEKLTGEGVTFVDTDFLRIVERELPRAYGGQSTDYQLVEEQDARGFTLLKLLVSPRVGEVDENEVAKSVIRFLKSATVSPESWTQAGPEMWEQAHTLRVQREYPLPTRSGKILPFHIAASNAGGIHVPRHENEKAQEEPHAPRNGPPDLAGREGLHPSPVRRTGRRDTT